jgi:hypothetical protein
MTKMRRLTTIALGLALATAGAAAPQRPPITGISHISVFSADMAAYDD